jgi:sugar lactone lactonase YvrE
MKQLSRLFPVFSSLFLLSASIAFTGCGGALNFPDSVAGSQAAGPPIQGSVFGGHAPVQGSHVYLLQPSITAYGGIATSLLGVGIGTTGYPGYPLTADATDPNVPVGSKFVTTDNNGAFNLTGAYVCAVGQPVYIYAWGGNIGPTSGTPTTVTLNLTGGIRTTLSPGEFQYTFTVSPAIPGATPLAADDKVNLSNFQGVNQADGWTAFNGTQQTVVSATSTSFVIDGTTVVQGQLKSGTATYLYTPTYPATQNNSIVELATLGNCPSSGNFSTAGNDALSYIYMNEVSTVATAYTFQPFTLATNNDAWHIGTGGSTQALLGIANAANTAAQLYNIQGGPQISSTGDGEGHLANSVTVAGNGVVPQTTIDTLANILAACIDSTPVGGGGPSAQCTTLFGIATGNGETTGTKPTDTAAAAINIARYPAGNHSAGSVDATYAADLFAIPTGVVPYAPDLASAPKDWTLSISYTGGGIGKTGGQSPHDVAIDAAGNIYTTNFAGGKLVKFSPLGVAASTTGYGANLNEPGSVAIDSTSSYVWLVNYANQNVSRFTTAGASETEFPTGQTNLQDAEIDGSGNIWVTTNATNALVKLNSSGTVLSTTTTNLISPFGLSIQPGAAGNIWVADETQNETSVFTNTGAVYAGSPFTDGGIYQPTGTAIDATGNVWLANHNGTVSALTSTGAAVAGSPFATGNTNYSDGIAIDGANHVWVTNSSGQTLYALTDTGAVISPSTGYLANPATQADGIAIDPSGNIWYDSYSAAVLHEIVGAAAPTVTPLSALQPGVRP